MADEATNDLRCYCCGKPVGNSFMLVSMQTDVDRVFIFRDGECVEQADARLVVPVQRLMPKEPNE